MGINRLGIASLAVNGGSVQMETLITGEKLNDAVPSEGYDGLEADLAIESRPRRSVQEST